MEIETKLRILMISDADSKYGAPHSFKQLIGEIKKIEGDKIEITVLLAKSARGIKKEIEETGCTVHLIPFTPFYQSYPYNKVEMPIKYIGRGIEYLYGRIIGVMRAEKIVRSRYFDVIHSNSSREDLGAILSEKYNIPLVWHIREFGDKDYRCYSYRRNYVQYINNHASKCVAISNAVRKHWISKGIDKDKIVTIYNGVEIANLKEKEQKSDIACVIMGNLVETKGHKELISALSMLDEKYLRKINVDIIGDGKKRYVNELKKMISDFGLEEVIHFCGYINNSAKVLDKYDIGFMCSRSEAFGRVTAEYMMAGVIVIAADTGANPELIEDGVTGFLYKKNDIEDLKDKIVKTIDNINNYSEINVNAYRRAVELFSTKKNAQRIMNTYYEIVRGNK